MADHFIDHIPSSFSISSFAGHYNSSFMTPYSERKGTSRTCQPLSFQTGKPKTIQENCNSIHEFQMWFDHCELQLISLVYIKQTKQQMLWSTHHTILRNPKKSKLYISFIRIVYQTVDRWTRIRPGKEDDTKTPSIKMIPKSYQYICASLSLCCTVITDVIAFASIHISSYLIKSLMCPMNTVHASWYLERVRIYITHCVHSFHVAMHHTLSEIVGVCQGYLCSHPWYHSYIFISYYNVLLSWWTLYWWLWRIYHICWVN